MTLLCVGQIDEAMRNRARHEPSRSRAPRNLEGSHNMHPLLALLSTAALLCPCALLADPIRPSGAVPDSGVRWSGFYAGLQVGEAFGRDRSLTNIPAAPALLFPGLSIFETAHPSGAIGGAYLGYDSASHLGNGGLVGVIGGEVDVDASGYRRITTFGAGNQFSLGVGSRETIRSGIGGAVRAKAGIASDRVMIYATGGVALAEFLSSYYNAGTGFDSFSNARAGYTAGAGLEYAFARNWSLRTEYRHSDFGTFVDQVRHASPLPNSTVRHRERQEVIQVGLSYRFAADNALGGYE